MLLTILLVMVVLLATVHLIFEGPHGAVRGGIKGAYYWLLGLSAWVIIILVLKGIWWILVILSIDILTPPYGIDIETLFAIPIATKIQSALDMSLGWALGIAYAFVFMIAASVLLFHWFVYRRMVE